MTYVIYLGNKEMPKEEYWIQRDGSRIAVGDMDIDHLRNTLRLIIRNTRKIRISTKYDEMSGIENLDHYYGNS